MTYLVVLVLDDPDLCTDVLDAWESTGINGVTILESSGIGRVRRAGLRDDLPLMPSLHDLLRGEASYHRTIFSAVENQQQIDALIAATQAVVGDLSQPNTGLLFVVPLAQVIGLQKTKATNTQRQPLPTHH